MKITIHPALLGVAAFVVIALKLSGVITWPWLWVLAPIWVPAAGLFAVVMTLCVLWGVSVLGFNREDR